MRVHNTGPHANDGQLSAQVRPPQLLIGQGPQAAPAPAPRNGPPLLSVSPGANWQPDRTGKRSMAWLWVVCSVLMLLGPARPGWPRTPPGTAHRAPCRRDGPGPPRPGGTRWPASVDPAGPLSRPAPSIWPPVRHQSLAAGAGPSRVGHRRSNAGQRCGGRPANGS